MITGAQPKILLTQDEDGNLKMDDEMGKLLFGDTEINWNYRLNCNSVDEPFYCCAPV